MAAYKKRIVDNILSQKLESSGALLIEGTKWCGKTTTAEQHAKSIIYMDDPAEMVKILNWQKSIQSDCWQEIPLV